MDENSKKEEQNATQKINIKMNRNFSIKELIAGVIILILLSYIVVGWVKDRIPSAERRETADFAMLEQSVRQIGELATLAYDYETVAVFDDQNTVAVFGREINIPGTSRSFIVAFDGHIRFGVEFNDIIITTIQQDEDKYDVRVSVPTPRIQTHEIDMESIRLLNESTGIFVSLELEDYTQFIAQRQTEIENRPSTQNLLLQAEESAHMVISTFLHAVLDEEYYTISFIWR